MKASVAQLYPTLLQPLRLKPTRLLGLWDSSGKNTGVGCHFLLQGTFLDLSLGLSDPEIEPRSHVLQADSSSSEPLLLRVIV